MTASDCDRLLRALRDHEARSIDPYAEGLRANYIMARLTLDDFVHDQGKLAREFGVEPGGSVFGKWAEMMGGVAAVAGNVPAADPDEAPPPKQPDFHALLIDLRLALTSRRAMAEEVARLDDFYALSLGLGDVPIAERLRRLPDLEAFLGEGPMDRILRDTSPPTRAFTMAIGRQAACLHATECLIALRLWQFAHDTSPADLLEAVKSAGMAAVPLDPYDGKQLRMALADSEPVIYSIGMDGVDDGGLVDSQNDSKPGDQLYRLPPKKAR